MSERYEVVEGAIREHISAFNAQNLHRLLTGLAEDAVWQTGQHTVRGHDELAAFFSDAFRDITPSLTILSLLIDQDRAACELRERMIVGGTPREDFIAGFYRIDANGMIASAKIYREGSASVA
jgi:hypothetical protein